jgi:probable phosphomutase (TIGR03848 family)
MTTFLLVRHGLHMLGSGKIAGRLPDVHLSPEGQDQAKQLAARLAERPIEAIYSSPLTRTRETADHIAQTFGLDVQEAPEIQEIDFGEWTGHGLDELRPQLRWKEFHEFRSGTQVPGGEWMFETQQRMVKFMLELRERHPEEHVVLVSHGDLIKSALAYFLGIPIDLFQRMEISTASLSVVTLAEYGPSVLCINETGGFPQLS